MIDIDKYIEKLENSEKTEIMDILKGKHAYRIANTIINLDGINEKLITSSVLIIYKYTRRIHPKLNVVYIIGDDVIGESFDRKSIKKYIPEYLKKYIDY